MASAEVPDMRPMRRWDFTRTRKLYTEMKGS